MLKIFSIPVFFFFSLLGYSQYDAECFINAKKEIKLAIENIPRDSLRIQDTILIGGVRRYVDTVVGIRGIDINPTLQKLIGCRMPDFIFFNLKGEEFSINKTKTDFTIVNFSFDCGDGCNHQLEELSKLQKKLGDSVIIYNIYELSDKKVEEYLKTIEVDNMEFAANADLITSRHTFGYGTQLYILDKYKNIIYVKSGTHYNYSPAEIFYELLEKIRATNCSD